ncbi:sensor histidine kinase [Taibaiella soli]|uniref:Signal transduction histidine kinase internal region domain-containing protein n=1 Tax=Taibaiella soli TaxID=1649169 RepID=A0A2W2AI27_9BACT|nr:histidine kinase [Taibaiella soli]PZF74911.1 hypothetical protein DN068_01565 [Taibaiella soli]
MKKSVIILLHIGYWLLFLLLLAFITLILARSSPRTVNINFRGFFLSQWMPVIAGMAVVPGLISFYSFYTVLFDRLFIRRRILLLIISFIVVPLLAAFIGEIMLGFAGLPFSIPSAIEEIIFIGYGALMNGVIGLVLRGFVTSYADIKVKEELGNKNHEMEMALIKAQLNPHFLFNTINNIDVLISMDPPKASLYLNKLSDIMRFMLYEAKTELVPLSQELSYLEKYIDLQRIRSVNPDYVHYSVSGNPEHLMIAPMLLLPFVENAFKHSENRKMDQGIKVQISITDTTISFVCENHYSDHAYHEPEYGGLGNQLIGRRIALLYPDKHALEITKTDHFYTVKLVLEADEN